MNKPSSKNNTLRSKGSCGGLLALALLTLGSFDTKVKAGQIWDGGATPINSWSNTTNWNPDGPPVYSAGIQFGGIVNLTPNNDLVGLSVGDPLVPLTPGITFNLGAGAFNLTGNGITLSGGIVNNSASVQTISFGGTGITLGAAQTWNSGLVPLGGLSVGSAVDLAGQALTVDGTNNTTISGAISDTVVGGSLVKNGLGTLLLSGTNTFTGTTTVNQGILQLQNGAAIADTSAVTVTAPGSLDLLTSETIGSLAGSGDTTLNANTLTTGGDNTSTTYSGVLSGVGGSLVKNGAGTFTTSNILPNTYTGTTAVNAGTLNVLGTHAGGGNYTIAAGATLSGTGIITEAAGASIFNNGAIVVGDSTVIPVASTLSITTSGAGAITMGAGSTLAVDLFTGAGLGNNTVIPGSSDTFNLGGNLNSVAGGTLVIGNPTAMTGFTGGDSWKVVNLVPGSITGNLGLTGNLDTSALNLTATQVGNFSQTSGVFTIIDTITGLQMANAMGQAVLASTQSVLTDVNGRLFFLRAGQGDLSDDSEYDQAVVNDPGNGSGKNPAPRPMVQRRPQTGLWQVFATANYNNARLGALGSQQAGIQSDSWSPGVGAEVHVTPNVAIGFALNWLESKQTFGNGVGSMDMNGYALSAYTSYVKKAFWADLLYSFGSYDIETNRNPIGFGMANGNTDAYTNTVQFNSGWNFRFQNNSLVTGPFIGLDYTHVSIDAYGESGGGLGALAYNKRTAESLISRIGWSVSKYVKTDFAVITAQARLSYERQNLSNNSGATIGLINQPFVVSGGSQSYGQDYMVAGAGLNFQFTPNFGLLLNYQGQFFRQSVQAHYVGLRLSYKF
ncbi:MAG: autotransporter domain-containing protein [Prosthecobacter sp.]